MRVCSTLREPGNRALVAIAAPLWAGSLSVASARQLHRRRYGWTRGESEEFIMILELHPVDVAHSARLKSVNMGLSLKNEKGRHE